MLHMFFGRKKRDNRTRDEIYRELMEGRTSNGYNLPDARDAYVSEASNSRIQEYSLKAGFLLDDAQKNLFEDFVSSLKGENQWNLFVNAVQEINTTYTRENSKKVINNFTGEWVWEVITDLAEDESEYTNPFQDREDYQNKIGRFLGYVDMLTPEDKFSAHRKKGPGKGYLFQGELGEETLEKVVEGVLG